jgi:pilus assembly protein CpaE
VVAYGGQPPVNGDWNGSARVLVVAPDEIVRAELRSLLDREVPLAHVVALESYPGRDELPQLAARPGTRLCLLDAASDPSRSSATLAALAECAPRLPVVAVLPGDDPDLILHCLRQGASEFLIRPFTHDQFRAVLARVARLQEPAHPAHAGARLVCGVPGKGASGTTTLVCNLAFALERCTGGRVLLADFDGLCGTVPFVLKLKSSYSFVDALGGGAIDADLWRALVCRSHGFDVLLSPESPLDGLAAPADVTPILDYARQAYDLIVADCGAACGESTLAVASAATDVLLVITAQLTSIHAAQRAMAHLEAAGIDPRRFKVVVNRYRRNSGLSLEQISQALGTDIFHVLPAGHDVIYKALLEGRPVPPGTPYGAAVAELASKLVGQPRKKQQRGPSLLSGFFARLRG